MARREHNLLCPPSAQSICTHFPASLRHFSLIILRYLAGSNELEVLPKFIFLSLDLSIPLSVAAPSEHLYSAHAAPSVYPSYMKSLSRQDVPWVSLHPSGSIWNGIHFIWLSNKFATRPALPTRGGRTILMLRVSWLQAATAARPAPACAGSHQLVRPFMPTASLCQNKHLVLGGDLFTKGLFICLCSPGQLLFALCRCLLPSTAAFTHPPSAASSFSLI